MPSLHVVRRVGLRADRHADLHAVQRVDHHVGLDVGLGAVRHVAGQEVDMLRLEERMRRAWSLAKVVDTMSVVQYQCRFRFDLQNANSRIGFHSCWAYCDRLRNCSLSLPVRYCCVSRMFVHSILHEMMTIHQEKTVPYHLDQKTVIHLYRMNHDCRCPRMTGLIHQVLMTTDGFRLKNHHPRIAVPFLRDPTVVCQS